MNVIYGFSGKVAEKYGALSGDTQAAFDPAIIIMIAEIVVELIKMLQEQCKKAPPEAVETLKAPSLMTRLAVRLHVRRNIKDVGGLMLFRRVSELTDAIFDAGKDLTVEEAELLYSEV